MIKIFYGKQGSGKTKKIIDMANDWADSTHGASVYIDEDSRCMLDLHHGIRFTDSSSYDVSSPERFYGFLCGILSQNYDIDHLFIDSLPHIAGLECAGCMQPLFDTLKALAEKQNINLTLSVSGPDDAVPAYLKEYIAE